MRTESPLFDAGAVWELFGGDVQRIRELSWLIQRDLPRATIDAHAALETGDWTTLSRGAHRIKGSAATIRAEALRVQGEQLAAASRQTDADAAAAALAHIAPAVEAVVAELAAWTVSLVAVRQQRAS